MGDSNILEVDIDSLVSKLDSFVKTLHFYKDDYSIGNNNEHIGMCINYADLIEMRQEFLEELQSTVISYVYDKKKQEKLLNQFNIGTQRDDGSAWIKLYQHTRKKFRRNSLQGQFSELLIFNLLQYHFRAIPLLRKMPITTNPNLERNGADAIHINIENGIYKIFIAEAKTYNRKKGGLKEGLKDAISDLYEKHYINHRNELDLYIYEDFISADIEQIAIDYKEGNNLNQFEVHLVCIVTYDMKKDIDLTSRDTALNSLIQDIKDETMNFTTLKAYNDFPKHLRPRLNLIMFSVKALQDLIDDFTKQLG
ncbi:DUF1837 domain-containing protein [Exiguobacterium sp. PHA03]|uniref:HamA C-terminal domain-containing protein n=1 Tax=Exiguobacterium sp. PHA03 TaxID=3064895 RepID=UPI0035C1B205